MHSIYELLLSWGPWGILGLASLDSAGIPLPGGVDALVAILSADRRSSPWFIATLAVIGSLIGNLVLFFLARKGGEAYLEKHSLSPRAQRFRLWFKHYGLLTIFIPALLPIPLPLKIFVLSAGALGVHPAAFIVVVLAARIPRYFGLAFLGMRLGAYSMTYLRDHVWELMAFSVALFAVLYLAVKWKGRRSRAALEPET